MAIHEECGVFGIYGNKREQLGELVYYGLYALQHRGQESCGIVVNDDGVFSSYKDLGLVGEVFSREALARLSPGNMAVGHVRYGTTGGNTRNNCQPMEVNHQNRKDGAGTQWKFEQCTETSGSTGIIGSNISYYQ